MQQDKEVHTFPVPRWLVQLLLVLLGLFGCWQLFMYHWGFGALLSITIIASVLSAGHRLQQQQQQINRLQQQVFDLEKVVKEKDRPLSLVEIEQSLPTDRPDLSQATASESAALLEEPYLTSPAVQHLPALTPNVLVTTSDQINSNDVIAAHDSALQMTALAEQNPTTVSQAEQAASEFNQFKQQNSLWHALSTWFKGGNSIVRVAVIVLLIGVFLLLRFASESWQLTLPVKLTGIALAGATITALGYTLREKRFDYAISLQGLGLATMLLVLFSAYMLQVIMSVALAYGALILLLAATLYLALKQNALILAFIALCSGFVAPFILSTGSNDVASLMAYYFILNAALAIIALFRPWRILNTVALFSTFGIGGIAVWFYAQQSQYFQISCWIWAIFALYLFISVRYTQHIVQLNYQLKDIALIDSSLIFATPFMVFSLYAGLVDPDSYQLAISSGLLAAVYFVLGYYLHRRQQQLDILTQCFYGLGFIFCALILPFAFNANWCSIGWAIHGIVMLYLAWRYHLNTAKYFAVILLLLSGCSTVISAWYYDQSALFASSVLMVVYALASYFFKFVQQKSATSLQSVVLASIFLLLSFVASLYLYNEALYFFSLPGYGLSVPLLAWLLLLQIAYQYQVKQGSIFWSSVGCIILLLSACDILLVHDLAKVYVEGIVWSVSQKREVFFAALLWCSVYGLWQRQNTVVWKIDAQKIVQQLIFTLFLMHLAVLGSIWASPNYQSLLLVILPLIFYWASFRLPSFHQFQPLWLANLMIIVLFSVWLIVVCLVKNGQWLFPYVMGLNPVDLISIAAFALLITVLRPCIFHLHRTIVLCSASLILGLGLLLLSSILLRMLYHYADLPYWSVAAWFNNTIQTSLTMLWTSTALLLTWLASRKGWRYIWILGIAVLVIVIAKLIFFDLSHSHTFTRIISFIGSGLIMLLIGYLAPLPPEQKQNGKVSTGADA